MSYRPVNSDTGYSADTLFHPDSFMPSQFIDSRRATELDPEKRLLLALLEDAIKCYQKGRMTEQMSSKTARLYWEARDWLFESGGQFTFAFVCEALNIDAEWFRGGLRDFEGELMRRSGVQTRPPVISLSRYR